MTRDVVVIGASLGGLDALMQLVAQLPGDLPASLLVVQHVAEQSRGYLAELLDARTPLRAVTAQHGMPLEHGTIYVAPPNRHMILTRAGVGVVYGPRENRARPAIDPLFRTAAANYRGRVIGVVLTGLLNDGTAGLLAVHRCGGTAIVQALDDAPHAEMPTNALGSVPDARQMTVLQLGAELDALVRQPAPEPRPVPETVRIEVDLTERAMMDTNWHQVPGDATDFTCPECAGAIRRIDEEGVKRYRCRVGHAYTEESLIAAKDDAVETALWVALQTLEERSQMLRSMVESDRRRGWERSVTSLQNRAEEADAHAQTLRRFIQNLSV